MNRWVRWAAAACWLAAFAATPVTTPALDNSTRLLGWWDERTKDDVKTTTCFRILNASGQDILLRVEFLDDEEKHLAQLAERTLTNRDLEELCVEDLVAKDLISLGTADHGTVDFRAVDPGEAKTPVAAIVGFQKELFYRSVQSAVGSLPGRPIITRRTLVAASEANLKSVPLPLLRPLPPKQITLPIRIRLQGLLDGEQVSFDAEGTAEVRRGQQTGDTIPIEIVALDLRGGNVDGTQVTVTVQGVGKIQAEKQDPETGDFYSGWSSLTLSLRFNPPIGGLPSKLKARVSANVVNSSVAVRSHYVGEAQADDIHDGLDDDRTSAFAEFDMGPFPSPGNIAVPF